MAGVAAAAAPGRPAEPGPRGPPGCRRCAGAAWPAWLPLDAMAGGPPPRRHGLCQSAGWAAAVLRPAGRANAAAGLRSSWPGLMPLLCCSRVGRGRCRARRCRSAGRASTAAEVQASWRGWMRPLASGGSGPGRAPLLSSAAPIRWMSAIALQARRTGACPLLRLQTRRPEGKAARVLRAGASKCMALRLALIGWMGPLLRCGRVGRPSCHRCAAAGANRVDGPLLRCGDFSGSMPLLTRGGDSGGSPRCWAAGPLVGWVWCWAAGGLAAVGAAVGG